MANESFSRKDFLKKVSLFSAAVVGTSTVLAACGGGSTTEVDPCADLTGVPDADKQMRTTLGYVKAGQDPAKRCDNCQLYVAPAEGASCGGCTLFKGPVHPGGYCNSWVAKMT
jgi:hypothetical protein